MVGGQLGTRQRPDRGVVAEGLVIGVDQPGQQRERLVGVDDMRVVNGVEVASGQLGIAELVVAVLGEADREGVDPLAGDTRREAEDRAAVGAAAQERARLLGAGVVQRLSHGLVGAGIEQARAFGFVDRLRRVPHVPVVRRPRPPLPEEEKLPRFEPPDIGEDRARCRDVPEVEVGVDGREVQTTLDTGCPQQRGGTRREGDPVDVAGVVQVAHAEAVHGQEERAISRVPERQGKGAAKPTQEVRSLSPVQRRQQALLAVGWLDERVQLLEVGQVHIGHGPDLAVRIGPLGPRRTEQADGPLLGDDRRAPAG